ncbi:hypothetical protein M422DRAFT_250229 [Sphaerobolus stellatus SS14]|uniref:Uncharacterized protein n=1 Tax=Sphaerobolus stellatus (strain SS14) TaxID=990650 RepID=A0A0C9VGM5_SPHS4|nr:hypothetical protein M422DRAFT_250229 [Sphaerobolus stellatus SS14]
MSRFHNIHPPPPSKDIPLNMIIRMFFFCPSLLHRTILMFRTKCTRGRTFTFDLFESLPNLEVPHINSSRFETLFYAPSSTLILPTLKILELSNIGLNESFLTFTLAPGEGIQAALPNLRSLIFHESVTNIPPF